MPAVPPTLTGCIIPRGSMLGSSMASSGITSKARATPFAPQP
uniref:Uncharacterized protein n=1 Tax=Anguilla anguilla TaxID=7936 RepID=A0A0E9PVE5_ANGAN